MDSNLSSIGTYRIASGNGNQNDPDNDQASRMSNAPSHTQAKGIESSDIGTERGQRR
jgi:hypothetical protein